MEQTMPNAARYLDWPPLSHMALRLATVIGAALLTAMLSACGFALKGTSAALPFKTVQVQAAPTSALAAQLQQKLQAQGITIASDSAAAVPRIVLNQETQDKSIVSTSTGRVSVYLLKAKITIQVTGDTGQAWLEPITFEQSRELNYSDSQILAKEIEEAALRLDMQQELLAAVMRRLYALRGQTMPPPAAAPAAAQ
jgi:LPS-assembly lipoprotein